MNTGALEQTARDAEGAFSASQIDAFRRTIDGPLAVVAAGGSGPAASFWAQLHERTTGYPAWPISPFALVDRGVPRGARVVLLSAAGSNHDILQAARRAIESKWPASAVVCRVESPLGQLVKEAGGADSALEMAKPTAADQILAVHAMVPLLVAAARVYGGVGPWAGCLSGAGTVIATERPRYVVSLGTGLAGPAAADFAYKCKESGLCPAWYDDVRDFAHGPFLTIHNVPEGALLAAFSTGPQRDYMDRFVARLPDTLRVARITAEGDGIGAGLSLFASAMRTFEPLARAADVLYGPERIPAWGAAIHTLKI
ncbi:MAG: hypothetical protein U0441_19280 [Polyangiaceae bacterium]